MIKSIKEIREAIINRGTAIINRGSDMRNVTKNKRKTVRVQKEIDDNQNVREKMKNIINEKQKLEEEN